MPTGYTADLCEKEQTFQEFALGCARAFGACILMRDDPQNTPIPDEFQPSDYHVEAHKKAIAKRDYLTSLTNAECIAYGEQRRDEAIKRAQELIESTRKTAERLSAMIERVQQWQPPTDEHTNFKKFMLEQLQETLRFDGNADFWETQLETATNSSPMDYYGRDLSSAEHGINYHTVEYSKEVERTNERNAWIRALRESLSP